VPVYPTDILRHVMYSLPNPSESERPFSPLEEPVGFAGTGQEGGGGRGTEWNRLPMLCARDATPLAEEVTGPKRPISLALGSWRWGGGYGGGEGLGLGMKGRGVAYFLP
jgi:hypothetical protein